jgi:hypothetical protein
MSLFFEDVEIVKPQSQPKAQPVVEDVTGLITVTLESEMAWHNLETSVMREEFNAVMLEDEKAGEGSKKNFFQQAADFFAKLWKSFVAALQSLVSRLQVQFTNGGKFLASRADRLNKYVGNKEASLFEWKVKGMNGIAGQFPASVGGALLKAIQTARNTGKALSADELCKGLGFNSFNEIDKSITGKARNEARKSVTVTHPMVDEAAADIRSAKTIIAHVKTLGKEAQALVTQGQASAKAGLKAVDSGNEEQQKKETAAISTAKSAQSVLNKIINVFVRLELERYADSMRVLSTATSGGKATAKDNAKASKQAGKNEKGKSSGKEVATVEDMEDDIFDLTLEDFEDEEVIEEGIDELEDFDFEV